MNHNRDILIEKYQQMQEAQKNFEITTEKDKKNQKLAMYTNSYNMNDKINDFFNSLSERQSSDKHFEESENYEKDKDKINKSAFYKAHNAILNNAKMQLTLGRIVENILFNYIKNKEYEEHAHSYIVDSENEKIKSLFSKWK
ncbi:24282_t:CDS:2 [Gigaspora rosea]|nr:24282_t:CDS:2 [Gigaspora rosea]